MKPIVLASSSPRRKKLLEQAGFQFITDPSNLNEEQYPTTDPYKLVTTLAREKAREVALRHPGSIIIGADTTVVCNGEMMAKPQDRQDARRMLALLSGNKHTVITGFAVIDTVSKKEFIEYVEGIVYFKKITEKQIEDYIETGEPFDKAGGYAIQEGLSREFIERFEGDIEGIIGLPVKRIMEIINKL